MNRTKQILLYVLLIIIAMIALVVVWHYFSNQIILGLGWVALFVLIFGMGFVLGRMSARNAKNSDNQIIKRDGE